MSAIDFGLRAVEAGTAGGGPTMASDGILPKGEGLRRAVLWLSETEGQTIDAVEEAGRRFNLSPEEEQFLIETYLPSPDSEA